MTAPPPPVCPPPSLSSYRLPFPSPARLSSPLKHQTCGHTEPRHTQQKWKQSPELQVNTCFSFNRCVRFILEPWRRHFGPVSSVSIQTWTSVTAWQTYRPVDPLRERLTGQTITQRETAEITRRRSFQPNKMDMGGSGSSRGFGAGDGMGWDGRGGGRGLGGGWLCHGRGRPMERRGPHAPADHNRGLIMSA